MVAEAKLPHAHVGEEMLTIEEAAAELKVSAKSLYPLCTPGGGFPYLRIGKRKGIRIPRSKFELYKKGELDEKGQPKVRPPDHQASILAGSQDWASLNPRRHSKKRARPGTAEAASS